MPGATHSRPSLEGERFRVAVIGGGINGVAIARECARAGARTLLIEQHDFAAGTTSRSTRIIHGGLRYLEHAELGLVRESLRERERLLRERPHLVRPLRFLLALQPGWRRNALAIRAGLWLYRRMAGRAWNGTRSADLPDFEQQLDHGTRWSVFEYEDAQCEFPERLVAEWLVEAAAAGAVIRNHAEALQIETRRGRVQAVRVRDRLSGQEWRVHTDWAINATGPWADRLREGSGLKSAAPMIGGVRGSHIVLPRLSGAPASAIYTEALDGRPIFLIPWNQQLLVGTTEVPESGDPGGTQPAPREIEYLLASVRRVLPGLAPTSSDIQYAFSGVRPLPYAPGASASAVTRRHLLRDHTEEGAAGMLSLIGGKLTTAAKVGREVARQIGLTVPEPAAVVIAPAAEIANALDQQTQELTSIARVAPNCARAVSDWFGPRAADVARLAAADERMRVPVCWHSEHIIAEAVYAAQHEHAVSLADLLLRRVPVALGACWSDECSRTAAVRIGAALGWEKRTIQAELEVFQQERASFLQKPAVTPVRISQEPVSPS